jgi:hypothetical protein
LKIKEKMEMEMLSGKKLKHRRERTTQAKPKKNDKEGG